MTRRTRRRIYAVAVAAAVGLGAPLWAPPLLSDVELFRVEKVEVTGVRYVSPAEVLRRADVEEGASVWDDPSGWASRVRAHPMVRDAEVLRTGIQRLEIRVREVEPVALVSTPELTPVDRRGRILPLDPARGGLDLPILHGEAAVEDGRITGPEVVSLLGILVALEEAEPGFVGEASEFRILEPGGVEVFMTSGEGTARRILLPRESPVRGLARIEMALGEHAGSSELAGADARFDGQVVLRSEGGGA
jgi:hypothetical protein